MSDPKISPTGARPPASRHPGSHEPGIAEPAGRRLISNLESRNSDPPQTLYGLATPPAARPDKRLTVPDLQGFKVRGEKFAMVTAYDAGQAALADAAGLEIVLVGDSVGNTTLGYDSTLPVTLRQMVHHTAAVTRGARRALVVGDMPWLSYHLSPRQAVKSAGAFVKKGGAQAVKLEGGVNRIPAIRAILDAEIPVMGHLGLTPQSVNKLGGYKVQGKSPKSAKAIVDAALALQDAGIFSLVLECVPDELAARITGKLEIPTIGIGAGASCDGQVLVWHDLLGLTEKPPRFVRKFADLRPAVLAGLTAFKAAVRGGSFPSDSESYSAPAPALGSKR